MTNFFVKACVRFILTIVVCKINLKQQMKTSSFLLQEQWIHIIHYWRLLLTPTCTQHNDNVGLDGNTNSVLYVYMMCVCVEKVTCNGCAFRLLLMDGLSVYSSFPIIKLLFSMRVTNSRLLFLISQYYLLR